MKNKKTDYKKNSKFDKKFVKDYNGFSKSTECKEIKLSDVSIENKGKESYNFSIVNKVVQTGGPTIFSVSDGTGTISLKAFDGAGVRAYEHVDVGDAIKAIFSIEEYNGEIEGEVKKIIKLNENDKKEFLSKLEKIEHDRARVREIPFLINSQILDKLKDRFINAATAIRLAIIQNRPIIVRHHNDADGYSSGFALERAILPLIKKQHSSTPKAAWEYYTRSPCTAPMYEIDDSIRDTAHSLSDEAKFSNKMPLVIIADTGSSEESLLGILQGKIHGQDFIVIDHHRFETDKISEYTIEHINPFLVEEDGAKFSAGMICVEFARFINPDIDSDIIQIPAMAGLADKIDNQDAISQYIKIAEKKGYTEEMLGEISTVIDFVSSRLRFMEAREYVEILFGVPTDRQKKLVELLSPHIRKLEARAIEIAKSSVNIETIKNTNLQTLMIEEVFPRGFWPRPGITIGMIHDYTQKDKKMSALVTLGILTDAMTIRATDEANFSVIEMIKYMNEKLPTAFVEGGGHKNAGSIKFIPNKQKEVIELIKNFIKDTN